MQSGGLTIISGRSGTQLVQSVVLMFVIVRLVLLGFRERRVLATGSDERSLISLPSRPFFPWRIFSLPSDERIAPGPPPLHSRP